MSESQAVLTLSGTRQGFLRMLPLATFVVMFGIAFGVAAAQRGLSPFETLLMSGIVFAGASQFAALELWQPEIALLSLLAVTFAVNSRHLLMGASLYPWLKHLPARQRYLTLVLLSDANWAMSYTEHQKGWRDVGILLGGGMALWLTWMIGTAIGVLLGSGFTEPERFGLDVIMSCFLLAMIVNGEQKNMLLVPWLVAAVVAVAAFYWLPANVHVIVGALAGGIAGIWFGNPPATTPKGGS